jgi:hypothetical protein
VGGSLKPDKHDLTVSRDSARHTIANFAGSFLFLEKVKLAGSKLRFTAIYLQFDLSQIGAPFGI